MYIEKFIQGNHSQGRVIKPEGVVTHHNYLSMEDIMKQMTERKPVSKEHGKLIPASYDCVGWPDGSRTSFTTDEQRAWHAGTSSFKGRNHCNNFMLGYCFYGNSNETPLTVKQIDSFIYWLAPRIVKWGFSKDMITTHRDVSPGRKVDLNPVQFKRILSAINYLWL